MNPNRPGVVGNNNTSIDRVVLECDLALDGSKLDTPIASKAKSWKREKGRLDSPLRVVPWGRRARRRGRNGQLGGGGSAGGGNKKRKYHSPNMFQEEHQGFHRGSVDSQSSIPGTTPMPSWLLGRGSQMG